MRSRKIVAILAYKAFHRAEPAPEGGGSPGAHGLPRLGGGRSLEADALLCHRDGLIGAMLNITTYQE